ncbi:retrotransposon protein, putative, ty1-copia subclass [Tanacetum coccineum]
MPANQEHMHLAWPLWSDLRVIPTHGEFFSLVRPQMTTLVGNNSVFRSFFEKQKLTGPNFIDWYRQLRLVLSTEDKEKYLEQPIPAAPVAAAPDQPISSQALATYNEWVKNQKEIVVMISRTSTDCERISHVHAGGRVSLILVRLSKEYDSFVQNYNMHSMGKTVNELHAMLKLHEETLPKKVDAPALHAIRAGKVQKNKNRKPSKAAKGIQEKGKGCGTHICNITQGMRGSKKLNPGALSLYMGNGQRAAVEAIRNYHLCLPSGLVIVLNNCHYAPSITRGIISVSRLYEDGFINRFELNNAISVSKNNIVYFSAIPRDGVYEIEMSCSNTNDSSMYAVSNKRAKLNLDSSLLWHCRLGHISKKRIEKLQHDGLLNSSDIESLGKCVSCMSGKMARKPYSHQVERAKDLLGLIHTDVCGPFRIMSRQGANYFVTFTDDFSRYGYVYLLKHKHEVFETFKVFQKEVENQLGKTIKSLRSDRGGEYMSQEFLDHLKEHGIIAQRTPPYTPQNNGVSERRNRTLLDMVRSMMSQTTLPKSFWDYALESAARILNMVPTKNVDKKPYEI